MQKRQQLRQAAVQFIYSISQRDNPFLDTNESNAIWSIVLEPLETDVQQAEAKVTEHLTRDYVQKLDVMISRAKAALETLKDDPLTYSIREAIGNLLEKESEFHQALIQLKRARKEDSDNAKGELQQATALVKAINGTLLHLRDHLMKMFADFPAYKHLWIPLNAACNKLQLVNQRLDGLSHPENNASYPEFKHVIDAKSVLAELKAEARELTDDILVKTQDLDALIDGCLKNYAPSRVHPIDRSILRLAAYELQYKSDVPVPVIIAEAIRLAEFFSTAEAARFINGVLTGVTAVSRA